jgi:predicted small metal-binding protein
MFADKALRCECGYEVQASDEAARVDEVRRHASKTHGIELSADVALDVVRRVRLVPSNEQRNETGTPGENRIARAAPSHSNRDGRRTTIPSREE